MSGRVFLLGLYSYLVGQQIEVKVYENCSDLGIPIAYSWPERHMSLYSAESWALRTTTYLCTILKRKTLSYNKILQLSDHINSRL